MATTERTAIYLKETDYARLTSLLEKSNVPAADLLDAELARAELVEGDALPDDIVAMGSIVTFSDVDNGKETTVTLVYPQEADVAQMKISVLTPVGSALIGLREGDSIDWPLPGGKTRRLSIVSVDRPPED